MILTEKELQDKLIKKETNKQTNRLVKKELKKGFWAWVKSIFSK